MGDDVYQFPGHMQDEAQRIGMEIITKTLQDKSYNHAKVMMMMMVVMMMMMMMMTMMMMILLGRRF